MPLTEDQVQVCECGYSTARREQFRIHTLKHERLKKGASHECHLCHKKFGCRRNLRAHLQSGVHKNPVRLFGDLSCLCIIWIMCTSIQYP